MEYRFLTTWLIEAPVVAVWEAIYDADTWSEWWPGLVGAERHSSGEETGVGQRGRYRWRAAVRYGVSFEMVSTRVEAPRLLEGKASGDLDGSGVWRLLDASAPDGSAPATAVLFDWRVRLARPGLRLAAPFAGPILRWNHARLMRAGAQGLASRLGCELLAEG